MFVGEIKKLQADKLKPQEQITLEPYERDHAVVVGVYRLVLYQQSSHVHERFLSAGQVDAASLRAHYKFVYATFIKQTYLILDLLIITYVAVPDRNRTLFRCVFHLHCCVQNVLLWNFH